MGTNEWSTSKCSNIDCAKGLNHTPKQSPNDTTNSTQQHAMNIHNGDNNEHVQKFDEVVSTQQQWWFVTPWLFHTQTSVPTPTIVFVGLQNHKPNPNIDMVAIDLEMEQIQLINKLEQLHHNNRKLSNQLTSMPHLECIEPQVTPTINV